MKLSQDTAAAIATNRFGLGARPGELAAARPQPKRWLIDQLAGPSRPPAAVAALPDSASALVEVQAMQAERRQMRRDGKVPNKDPKGPALRERFRANVQARTVAAVTSTRSFHERLVQFWSNHFAISADKAMLPPVAASLENEVVRRHLDGRFADLLVAAEKHPAMLLYLDNVRSIGANSTRGKRIARRRPELNAGLNENLAREILELHTLGVDGGYSQGDVTALANVITGWSVSRKGRTAGRFEFQRNAHEPGAKVVLGARYRQDGEAQGNAVLRALADHPSTARHVAAKLAQHFIADEPPVAAVDELARVFAESGGDLPSVHRALVELDAAWHSAPAKYKSPNDLLLSTYRAFDHTPENPKTTLAGYHLLGQMPFRPGSPAGYPDTADDWRGGNALYQRIEWLNAVARRAGRSMDAQTLADTALGGTLGQATATAMRRAESTPQALTLLLASPDFQRR